MVNFAPALKALMTAPIFLLFHATVVGAGKGDDRRNLAGYDATESTWSQHYEACSDEEYKLSLFVNTHVHLVASPNGETNNDCNAVMFHDAGGEGGKVSALLNEGIDNMDSLPLGSYKLSDLVGAYQDAEALEVTNYDIVHSNCATFVLSMMKELGLVADERVSGYTVKQLTAEDVIVTSLRESPNVQHLFPNDGGSKDVMQVDDVTLVELLVKNYIDEHTVA